MIDLLLETALARFGELSPAEERFFRAVADGRMADFGGLAAEPSQSLAAQKAADDSVSTTQAVQSGASVLMPAIQTGRSVDRVIRADRIAWLATAGSNFVTHRGIGLKGARIEGRLDLQAANIVFAIYFEQCEIPAGANLLGAEIHALNLSGSQLGRLSADGLKVEADVLLRAGFRAAGRVRLAGARIGGNLDCDGGQFIHPGSEAITADGMTVHGNVSLGGGFHAEGQVRLPGAAIGGSLSCGGGEFLFPGKEALLADRMKVEGNVFFSDGFHADGKVALPGAQVAGFLVWNGLRGPERVTLDLRSAKIGTLWMERASWPGNGKLLLHGLTYDEMDERVPVDAGTRIAWLRLQPATPFRPQPYEQLAAVMRKDGFADDAKRVLFAKEVDRARRTRLTWSEWPWYRLFGPLIGYGYKPWRAFWLSLAVVFLGMVLFNWGAKVGLITPAKAEAFQDPKDPVKIANFYPKFQPFMYSLDAFTPLISLDQADYWLPNANKGHMLAWGPFAMRTGSLLRIYLWFHIMAGWVLSTLLFVGLSGSVTGVSA